MTTKQSPEQSSSDLLDEILEKTYRYFNGISVWNLEDRIPEALIADKAALMDWHLQKCRSYLPSKVEPREDAYTDGWNECLETITKRIEGDK